MLVYLSDACLPIGCEYDVNAGPGPSQALGLSQAGGGEQRMIQEDSVPDPALFRGNPIGVRPRVNSGELR